MSYCGKLLNPKRCLWEPLVYSLLVRSMGGLDLELVSEVVVGVGAGAVLWDWALNLWGLHWLWLLVSELNCETSSRCLQSWRIDWCGTSPSPKTHIHTRTPDTHTHTHTHTHTTHGEWWVGEQLSFLSPWLIHSKEMIRESKKKYPDWQRLLGTYSIYSPFT